MSSKRVIEHLLNSIGNHDPSAGEGDQDRIMKIRDACEIEAHETVIIFRDEGMELVMERKGMMFMGPAQINALAVIAVFCGSDNDDDDAESLQLTEACHALLKKRLRRAGAGIIEHNSASGLEN